MAPVSGLRLILLNPNAAPAADPNVTLPVNPPSPRAVHAAPVVSFFEGGSALSDFRARQLLPRLQAVDPRIEGLSARFVHLVVTDHALDTAEQERYAALLGYGEPFTAPARSGPTVIVTPRLGTVSPWASKAPTSPTTAAWRCAGSSA